MSDMGPGLAIPEGAAIGRCRGCGQVVFAIKLDDGKEVLCQPVVIRGIVPGRNLVEVAARRSPEEQIQKLVSRTASGRFSPPILVPHSLVCVQAPLIRTLPAPFQEGEGGEAPRPEPPPPTPDSDSGGDTN